MLLLDPPPPSALADVAVALGCAVMAMLIDGGRLAICETTIVLEPTGMLMLLPPLPLLLPLPLSGDCWGSGAAAALRGRF